MADGTGEQVRVIGHRGASHDHPENTIQAFEGARDQGAHWVELDVRATLDGALVVHHDPHLADGRVIADVRHAELPTAVPTLEAALAACAPMGVNVEIKNSDGEPGHDPSGWLARATVEVVAASGVEVLVSSFDLATIDACREADAAIATAYLVLAVDEPADGIAAALAGGHVAVHPWQGLVDESVVARCHAAGLAVNVWTVDEPDRILQLAAWGVDGIVTNRPGLARQVLAAR